MMQKHTKIYLDWCSSVGIEPQEIRCEVCGKYGGSSFIMDIHHIDNRGSGGSNTKDHISNLMALCRKCHETYGDKKQFKEFLQNLHNTYIFNKL